ncbi:MAG: right-handed parallel beta-helix repeat-containing protein [Thermoanaerobaculia bacterium]
MPIRALTAAGCITLAALFLAPGGAGAATFTVTSTADSGAGSLRQAILDANGNPGADTIAFAIPAVGVQTISVATELTITDTVIIDGYTQPGSSANADPQADNAVILIDLQGNGTDGLVVTGGAAQIRGLVLHGFQNAIHLNAGGGSFVAGCWVGPLPSGQSAPGNAVGIRVHGTAADGVGDDNPANRNVISGNGVGIQIDSGGQSTVRGNLIGLNPAGNAALGNGTGVAVTTGVLLGGMTAALGNVISGNALDGVHLLGSGSVVQGNRIGLDATGFHALGNGGAGIFASAGSPTINNNFVSANASHGIDLSSSSAIQVFVNYIGSNVFGLGELGNGGAGVHSLATSGTINSNVVAHNRYGLWIETVSFFDVITWSNNSIFDNGGLGIVAGNPPAISGPSSAVLTSIVPNATTTTITGFVNVPVGAFVPTGVGMEFFSSPACSKRRPQDFDEGKTFIGGAGFTAFGSPASFSAEVPVVITDEVVTATVGFTACLPLIDGGCVTGSGIGPFSQRLPRAIDPASGSPAGGDPFIIVGTNFEAGATVTVGGVPGGNVNVVGPGEIDLTAPALPAGSANDVTVVNPDGSGGTISLAWLADFLDVPQAHPFHDFVRYVVTNGVATGVGGGNFGVDAGTLRQQMAVFLLKAKHGICYTPPPCSGVFADVPCPSLFADWIEALAAEGITGGCGGGNYCPGAAVRRDQMAAFLLKAEHGSSYVPPQCTGLFADVACPSLFADWIEQLATEQITGGCGGGNYCPSNPNTRGQMAVFLKKTFHLQ